jgi:predicted lipoprotein
VTRVLALLLAVFLAAPVAAATDADLAAVVTRSVGGSILPSYDALAADAEAMAEALEAYCDAPSLDKRAALAPAFAALVESWAAADFFRFGPMASEGRYERFAFWPDPHGTGARQLRRFLASKDEALLAPGAIAKQSAAVQGLPALESLLFSGDDALVAADVPDPYRCALAAAVAGNVAQIAAEAQAGWTGSEGWQALIENPGPENPVYRTEKEAVTEILKALLLGLEQTRDHRLAAALGATPGESNARRAPYAISDNALPYLRASARALEDFAKTADLASLLPADSAWMADAASFEFANLGRALAGGDDLAAALADPAGRERLAYAAIVLKSLRDIFQLQLAPAAGLSPGFNALDGD